MKIWFCFHNNWVEHIVIAMYIVEWLETDKYFIPGYFVNTAQVDLLLMLTSLNSDVAPRYSCVCWMEDIVWSGRYCPNT